MITLMNIYKDLPDQEEDMFSKSPVAGGHE